MYKALLHGYVPPTHLPEVTDPHWTVNNETHFALARLGFDRKEAAELTGLDAPNGYLQAQYHRSYAVRKAEASTIPQALAHLFLGGYLKRVPR
jgi:hypothetical protein